MPLDIVLPAHNEEDRIGQTLDRYRRAVPGRDVRFLVALDGCDDATADVVAEHRSIDRRVVARVLPKLGKGGALGEVLRDTVAPVVAFVDADGATPPAELLRLTDLVGCGGADVAIASRRLAASVTPTPRPLRRRITSAGFAAAVQLLFGLPYADTQCGAKALSAPAVRRLVPLLSSRDLVFDVDLLVTARSLGLQIEEVPSVWVDKGGSKVDALGDARRMAASLARLWLHHRVMPVAATPVASPSSSNDTERLAPLADDVVVDLTADADAVVSLDGHADLVGLR